MTRSTLIRWATLSILIAASACGSGDGNGQSPPAVTVSTLAYVVTECRLERGGSGGTIRQRLEVRQGDQAPIIVADTSTVTTNLVGVCIGDGVNRRGPIGAEVGVFHRLGVTPDGSQIIFEVTDEAMGGTGTLFPPGALPAEQKGIFAVRADATGLRRLGPASRVASSYLSLFSFSPNGRMIAYVDYGPSRDGADAVQVFTIDLVTGERRQVTELPLSPPAPFGGTYRPFFNDDQTITFFTYADADGHHPFDVNTVVSVKVDGTELMVAPPAVALPGAEVLSSFRITGSEVNSAVLLLPGPPVNSIPSEVRIREVFSIDRDDNVLQLTNFRRYDTYAPTTSADGERVLFAASTNELRTNPTENCQIFSIDRNGDDLRQLTDFQEAAVHSSNGCGFGRPPLGCTSIFVGRDSQGGAVVFSSSCDPFGTNPFGGDLFAMREDGTGLRQLTRTRGYVRESSGSVSVELPYPFAYPGFEINGQL